MHRFLVAIDINEEVLSDAYYKLHEFLTQEEYKDVGWESTDEAYDPVGCHVAVSALNAAREEVLEELGDLEGGGAMTKMELKNLILQELNNNSSRCCDDEEDVNVLATNLAEALHALVQESYTNEVINKALG